ncbi:RNA-binding Raly-like protein [Hoplias malabaricus]|uniref:RNA-binding Raly-like protein n=1 Tax=Hoplias malabaricus TaxID=27720 RepID=UPI003462F1D2
MAGDQQSSRYRAGMKRSSNDGFRDENHLEGGCYRELYERGSGHAPVSATMASNHARPQKRVCSSSSSVLQCSTQLTKCRSRISNSKSRGGHMRMEELQCIKRELKGIKDQIDELLNSLEHMETQNKDTSGSLPHFPLCSSVSSMEGSVCSAITSTRAFRERQSLEPKGSKYERKHESDCYYI